MAPTIPIQLRATREEVSAETVFIDGSRGEYDMSDKKRRSAETHNRKPINSLRRRLLVGEKTFSRYFMGVGLWARGLARHVYPGAATTPEPDDYDGKLRGLQPGRRTSYRGGYGKAVASAPQAAASWLQ
jgi:hypothetical protein